MAKQKKKQQKKKGGRAIRYAIVIVVLILLAVGAREAWRYYHMIYGENVYGDKDKYVLYIPTGADFETVRDSLHQNSIIQDTASFRWVANQMNYSKNIQPGRYYIKPGMSNRALLKLLRSGAKKPVKVTWQKFRLKENYVSYISDKLELDSASLMALLQDDVFLRQYGLTPENVMVIFIPDTYEFYWNTSASDFFDRMWKEYNKFWMDQRKRKAEQHNLTPVEATILASILEEETQVEKEMSKIAGVYLNRLHNNWKLQADPTVKYAVGDFSIRRVLDKHVNTESPYNTYRNQGIPPGPICTPPINAIESVLNAEEHDYYYFCAKPDMSGEHVFAKTHRQHIRNARAFQRALNERNIYQ
ncbi:MAG: endolytic transglycosylase MltG [Bacteroidetes bacterium SW_11_45_7]|nr:MAG: endolytic transglycosylase MltG [Bacteroidetes bacterium SW_11_45_7]